MIKNKTYLKHRNDQRGASLAYTLVIIAILMIIGAVLSTFAIMSLRLSTMQHASDKAFYLSDAAMVETLTQLESHVHEAEIYAVSRVNDTARYYSEPKWQAFLRKLEIETNNRVISKEESIRLLNNATTFEFEKQYYYFFFGEPNNNNWLEHDYTLLDITGAYVQENNIKFSGSFYSANRSDAFAYLSDITLEPSSATGFETANKPTMTVLSTFNENRINLELQSNGTYNRYNKPITLNLSLTPPDYKQVVSADSSTLRVRTNQVLEYGLAARGDIIVSGNNNTINGNVYTFGTFPNKQNTRPSELGGLQIGYVPASGVTTFPSASIIGDLTPNGQLTVNGDLFARTAVKLQGNNSVLTVRGDTYANTITFDEKSDNGRIRVDGNAYLFEDLILDGENPHVTIGTEANTASGELWGLMDTNPNFDVTGTASSLSSSIIVNTKSDAPRITVNKFYMAGLVYFDVTRKDAGVNRQYQTGESFTTNNNFYFYKTPLVGFNSILQSNFFDYVDDDKNTHYLVEAIDSTNGSIIKSPLFKDKYFYTSSYNNSSAISTRDRSILTVRSVNLDDPTGNTGLNNNYSLGVMIANNRVIDAYTSVGVGSEPTTSDYMDMGTFTNLQSGHQDHFDELTSLLSVRNYKSQNNVNPIYSMPNGPTTTNTESNLDQFVDFSRGQFIRTDNPQELLIVNGETNRNVYLNIPKSAYDALSAQEQANGIFIRENNDEFLTINGMIITKGNVYVYNTGSTRFTYNGTIVSDGNICLLGSGEKVFNHAPDWIALMSAKHDYLRNAVFTATGKVLERVNGTTSRNASLAIGVKDNTNFRVVSLNTLPTGNGLVKTRTNFSFKILDWSMK